MCRLYGMRSHGPLKVEMDLIDAPNSLLIQSKCDCQKRSHPDGWGMGVYDKGTPRVEKRDSDAASDPEFLASARRACSETIIAHVRLGSVGNRAIKNTHPFTYWRWLFAHNGTIPKRMVPILEKEIAPEFRDHRKGDTDSEAIFYWLLTRSRDSGVALDGQSTDAGALAKLLGDGVRRILEQCEKSRQPTDKEPALNLLMTDGKSMAATCWKRELAWVKRTGDRGAALIASEPTDRSEKGWRILEDGDLVSIDADLKVKGTRF